MKKSSKIEKTFYFKLIILFILFNLIGLFILSFTAYQLRSYEEKTPTGAIRQYLKLIKEEAFEQIYEESNQVFPQLNEKETYIQYLKDIYQNIPLNNLGFSKLPYSDENFLYYQLKLNEQKISVIQLKPLQTGYLAQTLPNMYYFNVENATNQIFKVNGNLIDNIFLKEASVKSSAFEEFDNAPIVTHYGLNYMLDVPKIEISTPYLAIKNLISDTVYIGEKTEDNDKLELIQTIAETYSKYITKDTSFNSLSKYLDKNSTFYKNISSFYNGWYSTHQKVEFQNIKIYDVIDMGEDAFIGSISYDYIVTSSKTAQTYPTTYQLYFIKINNKWVCTNIYSLNKG